MANYNQIGYGSQGSDVTELQKLLNQNGYNLQVDGIFGSNTQSAVRDYQQKNGLAVDGIVGVNTWGALNKAPSTNDSATQTPTETPAPEEKYPAFQQEAYKPSDTVSQAEALLNQQLSQKPGAYNSPWQDSLNEVIQKILNREKFSYDLNGDALYQQYKDQYTTQGKMAMMDTIGQASAMTGGYGNSYAQSVGQQAYQGHLQQLNEVVPELYQLAMNKYQMEGDALYDQAALIGQQEDRDYGRYADQLANWQADRDYQTGRYDTERDYDYSKWADNRDFAYGQFMDDRNLTYQQERDEVADQQWQSEFDEAKRQFDQAFLAENGSFISDTGTGSNTGTGTGNYTGTGTGNSTGTGTGRYSYDTHGLTTEEIKEKQRQAGITADGIWGPETEAAYQRGWTPKTGSPAPAPSEGFTGSTYSEAAAYLKENGQSASGLMTQSEWQRHKNGNNSHVDGGEHEADSYQEYLEAYVYGKTKG